MTDNSSCYVTIAPPNYPNSAEAGDTQALPRMEIDLDEENKTGSRSRFLRLLPGVYSTVPFIHDHWEEVYLVEGDLIVGNDINGNGGEKFHAPTYACRPPGVYHGPFKSDGGCVMFELHYYYTPDSDGK